MSKTGAEGTILDEAKNINKSLSAPGCNNKRREPWAVSKSHDGSCRDEGDSQSADLEDQLMMIRSVIQHMKQNSGRHVKITLRRFVTQPRRKVATTYMDKSAGPLRHRNKKENALMSTRCCAL